MVVAVDGFQVAHESGKSLLVGIEICARVRGEYVDGLAVRLEHARVTLGIGFDPLRHVVHVAVFPCSEPKDDQVQIVGPGALDKLVDVGEIKFAGFGLDLLPVNRGFHGVGVQGCHRSEHLRQLGGPGAGVVDLAAQDQIGLAFDQKGPATVFLDQLGGFNSIRGGYGKE